MSSRQIITDATTIYPTLILNYQILGDYTKRNNSPLRLSIRNVGAFIPFRVVGYVGTFILENMTLWSLVLFKNKFLGNFLCVIPEHVACYSKYVLRPFNWVGDSINQPILDMDRDGH